MAGYKEELNIEINKPRDEVLSRLHAIVKTKVSGDEIQINRHNSFLHLLAPTGKIILTASAGARGEVTVLNCQVLPSIFTVRSALGFIILSITVWSLIFWFFPLNVYIAVFFVLHWIIMCFVALYLLVGFMALLTLLLVIYNFHDFPLLYIIIAWVVCLLITHLSLRYNKAS